MRQCKVSRKVWQKGLPLDPLKPNGAVFQGKWITEEFFAVFHDFAIDTDTTQTDNLTYPVAIIELADGTVQCVHAEHVTFCNPTDFSTCE